ncbi:bifunctional [glutamine synthetase] adenylyltransferase/[glutamine synthetase]-adenylyl-L-tyrosine phosphorylase [Microbacterium gorillae]|uniref:bifunctional [glutamine synthetase] adenylyltransferase/[glutamine synthetase]-adenylyl-L-tyrosine phosphorylase n=1 Tax=Microbacterium gorillae TaxID=1231063 RepID=UPI00058D0580|nr:bifunctional [glutamine synthetase] adenylyltransferase/[glutamine synthetase]-adenylyl-L-tyrosine phosphorylase [Microbacterium gorillae]
MATSARSGSLTDLARRGFSELSAANEMLDELATATGLSRETILVSAPEAADPDAALRAIMRVVRRDGDRARADRLTADSIANLWRTLGASDGLADFAYRHPEQLVLLAGVPSALPEEGEMADVFTAALGIVDGFAASGDESAWNDLRVSYRRQLARIATWDLAQEDPIAAVSDVSAALADLAGAAIEASLAVARTRVAARARFSRAEVDATRLAIIGMGKTGARELNYVSDVDVIYVAESADENVLSQARAIDVATALAVETMRGVSGMEREPALWEVDANLRPEGKQGALVRSLESHVTYYDRWAASWEFQALLKARPIAGDPDLGDAYIAAVRPKVWQSSGRDNFVESVQRMRKRVTDNIPADEVDHQLKLGPGGLRDVEFTVQLLQLVHGRHDESIRDRGTLDALDSLVAEGYIGREDAAVFARDYRILRVLEHRLQLRQLRRTHLMPDSAEGMRFLARASQLAETGPAVQSLWERVKREIREIHVRLFYRPLLSAVAALGTDELVLTSEQARDRLAAIGFADPAGALRHIAALTAGLSRKATIQRHLMPVMLLWFSDGVDPDYGLLAFRRISERLGDSPWFLRMLRDSSAAAQHLTQVLSSSRYVGELMEWIPESVAWLDDDAALRPRGSVALLDEARAIQKRHATIESAMRAVRALRRRELLRTAMGALLDVLTIEDVAEALTSITEATIQATLRAVFREVVPPESDTLDFTVIAMGRFGGRELGFGSDADVMFVFDPQEVDPQEATTLSLRIVAELRRLSEDPRVPLDLDADLRPEGRNGPLARSYDAYVEYYARWSEPWEAQALLRAEASAGSRALTAKFMALADSVRYPVDVDERTIREIKRIKARVESERLPQGADRSRHLKLGPGSLSDVEWLVQLWQLENAHAVPAMRTTSTLGALAAAEAAGIVGAEDAEKLREAWLLASRLRSANTLLTGRTSDVLPTDRKALDGIARLLGYPQHSATQVEEDYLATTRRSRRVFDRLFYG